MTNSVGIHFNGDGEDGHETFILAREANSEVCKTERKPYDLLVQAVLIVAQKHTSKVEVSSDGHDFEWSDALGFVTDTLGDQGYGIAPGILDGASFIEGYQNVTQPQYRRQLRHHLTRTYSRYYSPNRETLTDLRVREAAEFQSQAGLSFYYVKGHDKGTPAEQIFECRHYAHAKNKARQGGLEPKEILDIGGMDLVAEFGDAALRQLIYLAREGRLAQSRDRV